MKYSILSVYYTLLVIIAATDYPFGNRSRRIYIRTRAEIKIIFCNYLVMQAFKNISFQKLFCLKMKTGVFESLLYKIITKNYFYFGSCPFIYISTLNYLSKHVTNRSLFQHVDVFENLYSCPVILVAVIKVGDITVAVIWVGSEV